MRNPPQRSSLLIYVPCQFLMLGGRIMVVPAFVPWRDGAVPEVYNCVRLGRMPAGGIVSWVL